MKFRNQIDNNLGFKTFDLTSDIIPNIGAGGVNFNNTFSDFEFVLTNGIFNRDFKTVVDFQIDNDYFYITIHSKNKEFAIELDMFTGKICSMICNQGYTGELIKGFGIGSSMNDLIKIDSNIGFDLDNLIFARAPFDGLIIRPPYSLVDKIYSATCDGLSLPDFKIETLEILDISFAKKCFGDTLFND